MSIEQHGISAYKLWREMQNDFPKKSRLSFAIKIDGVFTEVLEMIFSAHYLPPDQKLPFLQRAIRKMDLLKFFLQVAWEVKDVNTKKYAQLSEPVAEIGRMLGSWYKNIIEAQKKLQPPLGRMKNN